MLNRLDARTLWLAGGLALWVSSHFLLACLLPSFFLIIASSHHLCLCRVSCVLLCLPTKLLTACSLWLFIYLFILFSAPPSFIFLVFRAGAHSATWCSHRFTGWLIACSILFEYLFYCLASLGLLLLLLLAGGHSANRSFSYHPHALPLFYYSFASLGRLLLLLLAGS
jgi:hypothetical protein